LNTYISCQLSVVRRQPNLFCYQAASCQPIAEAL